MTTMEIVKIGLLIVLINVGFWAGMLLTEWWDAREGLIPSRGPEFMYFRDFSTIKYGDPLGISFMDASCILCFIAIKQMMSSWILFVLLFIAIGVGVWRTMLLKIYCTNPNHKPDSGFPWPGTTKISHVGKLHICYFAAGWAMAVFTVLMIASAAVKRQYFVVKPAAYIFYLGLILYGITVWMDMSSGRFDLKKN